MQPTNIETKGGVYCSVVRLPKQEGTFTLLRGEKYLMPDEDRWASDPGYVEAVVIGLKYWGPNGEELFSPTKEDVKIQVTMRLVEGEEVEVEDEFYQESYTSFVECEGGQLTEEWSARRV